jgi:type II secretory pathway pseudopilin PulG
VELAIVIVVLGIISAIAMSNFIRFRHRANYAACVANQRNIVEASLLYISITYPGTTTFDVDQLTAGGYLPDQVADCPLSTAHTMNDYTVSIVDNSVTEIECKIEPAEHLWHVP